MTTTILAPEVEPHNPTTTQTSPALAFYDSAAVAEVMSAAERNAQAFVGLERFNSAWLIGLPAFGLHRIVLGFFVAQSVETPRWLDLWLLTRARRRLAP